MNKNHPGSLWADLEPLLARVERPSRYIGGEWNATGTPGGDNVFIVLAYPDVYEIGTSHLGLSILREVADDVEGGCAERAYSPWPDMEREMRRSGIPLFTLETHRPVASCDVFGISIPHELTFTNILNLIDLAGLPLRSADRDAGPLVVGGGCGAANPEPLADFFDIVFLGEGEEVMGELVSTVHRGKKERWSRRRLLEEVSKIPGAYRPADYVVEYRPDGAVSEVIPQRGAPARVSKRLVDIDRWLYPRRPVVPFCEAVHDRLSVELFRGCTRGCRFCQAGMTCRPVRERAAGEVVGMVESLSDRTGYDEVSLCSLSSTDYSRIEEVASRVHAVCQAKDMAMSLPSLRMDGMSAELAGRLDRRGRGGLTFAPEAGTERLRAVVNKNITEKDMSDAVLNAVRAGRRRVKLYFMIGLPTETDEDVEGISRVVFGLRDTVRSQQLQPPSFNVSVSTFVPKPHTPFEWCGQITPAETKRRQSILRSTLRAKSVNLSWHDSGMSVVEGLLARGDRRLGRVVERCWADGARFDSWSEHFDGERWMRAVAEEGLDPAFYLYRERGEDEVFPWDHLDFGVDKSFLRSELEKALRAESTVDCRYDGCVDCGVCEALGTEASLKGAAH